MADHVLSLYDDERTTLEAVVDRMARGDRPAVAELYERTKARVYGLALRITRSSHLAEEAVVEAFTQAWRGAARFSSNRGTALGWLLSIARTRALDLLRAAHRDRRVESLDQAVDEVEPASGPAALCEAEDEARQVRVALTELPTVQREAIATAYYSGLSHTGVARKLGVPVGTVKSRIRAGMNSLRRALAAEAGQP